MTQLISTHLGVLSAVAVLLLLTDSCGGQRQLIGPLRPIVATVGDAVILPCYLKPAEDAFTIAFEWSRPDLNPRFVRVWRSGEDLLELSHPSYKGRTSLSMEKLRRGDISLELLDVKVSDEGKYRCYIPEWEEDFFVVLVVGAVSSPVLQLTKNSSMVVLQCESGGWYPEPELLWLDGEGNLLPAGPAETLRGPDGLYTVSSRVTVTVEKRRSNSFTCRVQQKNINQTTEDNIQITADCSKPPSCSAACVGLVLLIFLNCIAAAAFAVWKWRQHKAKETKTERRESEQLMGKENGDLGEKKKKLEEELEKKEEEQKDLEQVVKTLTEQTEELKHQRDQCRHQTEEMEKEMQDIEKMTQSMEKMAESEQIKGYTEMKEIMLTAKSKLLVRKQENQKLHQKLNELLTKTERLLKGMTDMKTAAENHKEKMKKELEEIQRKLESEQRRGTSPI